MSKVAVVYWSGTGNTESMANAVVEGAQGSGADVTLYTAADFNSGLVDGFDAIGFGCPAMGAEILEEDEFEPMFADVEGKLSGKKIALFGSYGWGDGQWMRDWHERCAAKNPTFVCDDVMCNDAPDDGALDECRALGKALAF